MSKWTTLTVWTTAAALGIGLGVFASPELSPLHDSEVTVRYSAEYVELTEQEMMQNADVIFVGRVRHISDTRWNQDDEQPWKSSAEDNHVVALPLHELEIEVERKLVDKRPPLKHRGNVRVQEGENTVLTVLGNSPWSFHDHAHHDLVPGDRAVLFARYSDLAWRGHGTKPVLQLVGVPSQAHFIEEQQGLFYNRRQPEQAKTLDELNRGILKSRSVQLK